MAESLPSPPSSRSNSPGRLPATCDQATLIQRLDELLVGYLEALDEYTKLRETLSKSFSRGFMSLAHAQRTSNLGPGRRYGQDGYDGRMKAIRRVQASASEYHKNNETTSAESKSQKSTAAFDLQSSMNSVSVCRYEPKFITSTSKGSTSRSETLQDKDRDIGNEDVVEDLKSGVISTEHAGSVQKKSKIDPSYRDPVTWYGILVPSALRQAQQAFQLSVDDTIPQVISSMMTLQRLEAEIDSARLALLALGSQDSDHHQDTRELVVRMGTGN